MKILSRAIILSMVIVNFIFVFGGCAGFKDIEKRFFVVGVGIDKATDTNNLYRITLKLAIPTKDPKEGPTEYMTITVETSNIAEAVRSVKSKVDKELEFSQMKIILLGESYTSQDISPAVDWLLRRRDIQKIALIGIGRPNAQEILELKPKYENLLSDYLILPLSGMGTESNYITPQYLFDFYRRIRELGIDPVLPVIKAKKEGVVINELALFSKDNGLRVQNVLLPEETKLYNLICNEKAELSLEINSPEISFVINVQNVKSNYEVNNANIQYKVKISGIIEESSKTVYPENFRKYEALASEVVKHKINHLLNIIHNYKVDPAGYGLYYRSRSWKNDTEWQEWKKLYPELQFSADVDVKLKSTGLIN